MIPKSRWRTIRRRTVNRASREVKAGDRPKDVASQHRLVDLITNMKGEPILVDGEAVILMDRRGRRYLKHLKAGHQVTIRGTVIGADDIIGSRNGGLIAAKRGEAFRVFRPTYAELIPIIARDAEPIFAKDAATIVCRGDIQPGQTVIEVGAGAGALAIALLRAVGPSGKLITYEIRDDFALSARHNVEIYEGHSPNWEIKVADAKQGFDETNVDRVVVDMPEPHTLLAGVHRCLVAGGVLVSFVPTVVQLKQTRDALDEHPAFDFAQTYEILERTWYSGKDSLRPDHRMVAHTGFITTARHLAD